MRIVKLEIKNVKKIKAITLTPNKNVNTVGGKNGQGKSSILDSMMYALGGRSCVPSEPIRKGEDKAEIKIEVDGYKISKTITENNEYLKVTSADGKSISSPQKFLNDICNGKTIAFDPIAFAKKTRAEQASILKDISGINTEKEEAEIERLTELKRDIASENRMRKSRIKAMESEIAESGIGTDNVPTQEEISEATSKLNNLDKLKADLLAKENLLAAADRDMNTKREEIKRINENIKRLQAKVEVLKKEGVSLKEHKEQLKSECDSMSKSIHDIEAEIGSREDVHNMVIKMTNAQSIIHKKEELEKEKEELKKTEELIKKEENAILSVKERILNMIENANMPIKNLKIVNNEVHYNDVPFDQASQAEQIKVGMAISFAMNKDLKIALIRDGSLLDADSMRMIERIATKYDGQVWVEVVTDDMNDCSIYIEDGEEKHA